MRVLAWSGSVAAPLFGWQMADLLLCVLRIFPWGVRACVRVRVHVCVSGDGGGGRRERAGASSVVSSYKGTSPILGVPPSCPANLPRLHLQMPSH